MSTDCRSSASVKLNRDLHYLETPLASASKLFYVREVIVYQQYTFY